MIIIVSQKGIITLVSVLSFLPVTEKIQIYHRPSNRTYRLPTSTMRSIVCHPLVSLSALACALVLVDTKCNPRPMKDLYLCPVWQAPPAGNPNREFWHYEGELNTVSPTTAIRVVRMEHPDGHRIGDFTYTFKIGVSKNDNWLIAGSVERSCGAGVEQQFKMVFTDDNKDNPLNVAYWVHGNEACRVEGSSVARLTTVKVYSRRFSGDGN